MLILKVRSYGLAPIEYVILRKLQYYREGRSEKHLRDVSGILEISPNQIDFKTLKGKIKKMGLEEEWEKISKHR